MFFEKRRDGIFHDNHIVASVRCVACGGFDTHVGGHSSHHQRVHLKVSQDLIDTCSVKRTTGVLVDDEFAVEWRKLIDDLMLETAFGPECRSIRFLDGIGVTSPPPSDHVSTVGQQSTVTCEDYFSFRFTKRFEQPSGIGDRSADSRDVIFRDLRVLLDQHLCDTAIGIRAVVLIIDENQRYFVPINLERRPRHYPTGKLIRRVDPFAHFVFTLSLRRVGR